MNLDLDGLRVVVTAGAPASASPRRPTVRGERRHVQVCDIDRDALETPRRFGIDRRTPTSGDTASVDAFMTESLTALGGIDVLVNNAGIAGPGGPVETIDPEEVTHGPSTST